MPRFNRFFLISVVVVASLMFAAVVSAGTINAEIQATAVATAASTSAAASSAPAGDIARGKYLVTIAAGCGGCHSNPKLPGAPLAGGMEFDLGPLGTFYAPNLTILQKWTYDDFDKAIRQGSDPDSPRTFVPVMPYMAFHGMSDSDLASIVAYLQSLPPVQNDVPDAKPGPIAAFAFHALPKQSVPAPTIDDSAGYGAYLVQNIADCGGCHSPRDRTFNILKGKDLMGGGVNLGTPNDPIFASPIVGNVLTAEGYTKEGFINALRTGVRPWGALLPNAMPWRTFGRMTDNDLTAIWNYLQTTKVTGPWPTNGIVPAPTESAAPAGGAPATPAK